jgi:hypothetical protein
MNRRNRRAASKGRRPRPVSDRPHRLIPDEAADTMLANCVECRYGTCRAQPRRWYLRADLAERRLIVYPTCALHAERAEAASCAGGCLAPQDEHYVSTPDELMVQLDHALHDLDYGVGFPRRGNWDLLDVIRVS